MSWVDNEFTSDPDVMNKILDEWLAGRPESIRALADKIKPWCRYRIKATGQHCVLSSYNEYGTVRVTVNGHDDYTINVGNVMQPFYVFGIIPDDLEII